MSEKGLILFKMESLNKDLIFEIGKYVLSYDLKSLFFAFPFLNIKEIYLKKRESELAIIEKITSEYLCLNTDMAIINIFDSELRHFCIVHSIQERFTFDEKINYQAEIDISIHPDLVIDFCREISKDKIINDNIEIEFKLQLKNSYLHFWIKNFEEINSKLKRYALSNQ